MQTRFLVGNETELNAAIKAIDVGGTSSKRWTNYTIVFEGTGRTLGLTSRLYAINLAKGDALTIKGRGGAIDGLNKQRGLFVYSGKVTIEHLTIENAVAWGGKGGRGGGGGGAGRHGGGAGGAGLGGGLFVADDVEHGAAGPGKVVLDDVDFKHDAACGGRGGAGGSGGGGGGGMGGNGADGYGGGGGGLGWGAVGGAGGLVGRPGIILGAGNNGGGGAGAHCITGVGCWAASGGGVGGAAGHRSGTGGQGGFGGGGGGGGAFTSAGAGGEGGFGGGGGAGAFGGGGGDGGFGGGGGAAGGGETLLEGGAGGFGGGDGAAKGGGVVGWGGGGGGLGAGADIFVMHGASLTIAGGSLSGGVVKRGVAGLGTAQSGKAFGSGVFLNGDQRLILAPAKDHRVAIADDIADQTGSGGKGKNAGAGQLVKTGAGRLILSGDNTFTGGIQLLSGRLVLASADAAGTGVINFRSKVATLEAESGDVPANKIGGLVAGDTIILKGVAADAIARVGTKLELMSGGAAVATLTLTGAFLGLDFKLIEGAGRSTIVARTAPMTAAQFARSAADNDQPRSGVEIVDTAAHVAAKLDALEAGVAQVGAIHFINKVAPTLTLTAREAKADARVLDKIVTRYVLDVHNATGSWTSTGRGDGLRIADIAGKDTITGGGSSETFVFKAGFGEATLVDFHAHLTGPKHDVVQLAKSEFADFATLLADAKQAGGNVLVAAANGDRLTLDHMTLAALSAAKADFKFV